MNPTPEKIQAALLVIGRLAEMYPFYGSSEYTAAGITLADAYRDLRARLLDAVMALSDMVRSDEEVFGTTYDPEFHDRMARLVAIATELAP
jgi:hypothetical protein